jgi:glycosyltransferase involved in cell wall biosynthesis
MSKSRISVALCTYNGATFLSQQLESIGAQFRPPDELVVYDDRSVDETVDIIRTFADRAPCTVRLEINEERLGSTKNFEKAIAQCQGDIIALADQDHIWRPRKLAVLEKTLIDHPEAGYAFADAELIDDCGVPIGTTLWQSVRGGRLSLTNFSRIRQVPVLLRRALVTGATMAFRSDLKKVLLPISSSFVHDYWISLLASSLGWTGISVPESLIQYRQHAGQQIGALRMTILQKIKWARQTGPAEYGRRTQGFQDLRERLLLATTQGYVCSPDDLDLIEEKIRHCSQRAVAHSAIGSARVGKVLSEVLTGRYARYSNSWRSVVEDLCF